MEGVVASNYFHSKRLGHAHQVKNNQKFIFDLAGTRELCAHSLTVCLIQASVLPLWSMGLADYAAIVLAG